MNSRPQGTLALGALLLILAITAGWWALALWPVEAAPAWLLRTREVCFGAREDGLPHAGGWVLLVGQPLGMLVMLALVWPRDLSAGLARILSCTSGRLAAGTIAAALVAGMGGVMARLSGAAGEPFSAGAAHDLAAGLTRIDDAPPPVGLVDQHGEAVTLAAFEGRPVLVTFAFAHCETVCPLLVADVLEAAAQFIDDPPVLVIVTLDPWRDTPSRLPAIARAWRLTGDAHVVSGEPDAVDRVVNSWRVPRVRNERTGDLSHPSLVYVIGRDGRITYVVSGGADVTAAALRAL